MRNIPMRTNICHMLEQTKNMLAKKELSIRETDFLGIYQYSIDELIENLKKLGRGEMPLDDFINYYCLKDAK